MSYPRKDENGRTVWACCLSKIGPACKHINTPSVDDVAALMRKTHTGATRADYGTGWRKVPSWGRDGWDLGQWPYVIVSHREQDGRYDVKTYCEGDVDVYSCETVEDRDTITDYLAWFYWESAGASWVQGVTFQTLPGGMRGPFSWARLERDTATP